MLFWGFRLVEELQACHHVGLSTDVWSDSSNGNFYTTVSGHYFLEDCFQLNLKTRILTTTRISDPKSSEVAWEVIESVIDQYSLDKDKITIVTDNEELRKLATSSKHVTAMPSALGCLNTIVNSVVFNEEHLNVKKLLEAVNVSVIPSVTRVFTLNVNLILSRWSEFHAFILISDNVYVCLSRS